LGARTRLRRLISPGRVERIALWCFVAASVLLRVILAVVNHDANDDHMAVVDFIITHARLARIGECFECGQAQFYHSLVARTVQLLGLTGQRETYHSVGQVYTLAAGLATLAAGCALIREATSDERLRLRAFALFACNPALVELSVQASNDGFAVCFGSLCIWLTIRLTRVALSEPLALSRVLWPAYSVIAAGLSKANGVVIFLATALVFLARVAAPSLRAGLRWNALAALGIVTVPAIVLFLAFGPYVPSYEVRGSPFALGVAESGGLPKFCEPTPAREDEAWQYPGVLSICDGYLTFKIADVVRQPYITIGSDDYSGARTSLWTQLYARSHFLYFENWPASWRMLTPPIIWLGRLSMIAGLLTLAITAYGFAAALYRLLVPPSIGGWIDRLWSPEGAVVVFGLGLLASSAWLNAVHRDSANMKAIYVYPAILCAAWSFVRGAALLAERRRPFKQPIVADRFVGGSVFVNCVLYLTQIAMLTWKLAF
jgi:hypothetical protein